MSNDYGDRELMEFSRRHWQQRAEEVGREVERLRAENVELRSCAAGPLLDDYREAVAIVSDYALGGPTLAGRLRVALDGLKAMRDAPQKEMV